MATCKFCEDSGWALPTNGQGLCKSCEVVWEEEVSYNFQIAKDSLELASKTKKLGTMLSRLQLARDSFHELLKYERRDIPTTQPPPSESIKTIETGRQKMVLEWVEQELVNARLKSQTGTTPASKTRPYTKLLESFSAIYAELDDVKEIEKRERAVRQEMDTVRLDVELERAEKAAFKGQKKRACDAYLDALYLLRKDSIPDDQQRTQISEIESKIKELGGEIPPST
ncbi:MAG: hypothetical protein OXK19_07260 [Candidatus Dadabacteria bacterium]|nr:hypothetical protein [Candidatus Dadabacteria bacterium]